MGGGAGAVVEGEAADAAGDLRFEGGGGGDYAGGAGGAVYGYAEEVVGFGSCGWGRGDFDIVGFEEVGRLLGVDVERAYLLREDGVRSSRKARRCVI